MITTQEVFWKSEFGSNYIGRNSNAQLLASSSGLFSKILQHTSNIRSVIEFGANIGINLVAIQKLLPKAKLSALEINSEAVKILKKLQLEEVFHQSIFDFKAKNRRDFVFTRGVLIHLNPDRLKDAYKVLYESSHKYICIAEYYNPTPISINYRGYADKLFKRDFAGEIMELYSDLSLIDYGFVYHRDPNFPQDDITWFLLEKKE